MNQQVIAEIGINHDGSAAKAKRLIEEVAESGCFAIKFQCQNVKRVCTGPTSMWLAVQLTFNRISKHSRSIQKMDETKYTKFLLAGLS